MIEIIQMWIWNIGGFLFTIMLIISLIVWIFHKTINYLMEWSDKEQRTVFWYYMQNRKEINKIVEERTLKQNKVKE